MRGYLLGAGRLLVRQPFFSAIAVATLAVGIGATVTILTVVDGILLQPLPYPDSDRIVTIEHHAPGAGLPNLGSSPGMARFYEELAPFLRHHALADRVERGLTGLDASERVVVVAASPALFEVFRVRPHLGRHFATADRSPGDSAVAVLSYSRWRRSFGADPAVLGRSIRLDGVTHEIIGVMPAHFGYPDRDTDIYVPYVFPPDAPFGRFGYTSVARLAPGTELSDARQQLGALQVRLTDQFGHLSTDFLADVGWTVSLERLRDAMVRDVRSALWIIAGAVFFLLLLAFANVANLFLVRGERRRREFAIRDALGAGRHRLVKLCLVEGLTLASIAGALAVLMAWLGVEALTAAAAVPLPRLDEVGMGWPSAGVALSIAICGGLVAGGLSVVHISGARLAGALRSGGRTGTEGHERHRARKALVVAQLSSTIILLVGSGLLFRSLRALHAVEPGFDPVGVVTVDVSLGMVSDNAAAARLYGAMADDVAALPGVAYVGVTTFVPLGKAVPNGGSLYIESRPEEPGAIPRVAMYKAIGRDYLDALRQPLVAGRHLSGADWDGPPVALVNQEFVERFLNGRWIGEGIKWDSAAQYARVIGVVADAKEVGLRQEAEPWAYLPLVVGDWGYPNLNRVSLVVRPRPGVALPPTAIREIIARHDPSIPSTGLTAMSDLLAADKAQTSFTMALLAVAALAALFLALVGVYGIVAYSVSLRSREMGLRMALGATPSGIRRMIVGQGMILASYAAVLGTASAFGLTRFMRSLLFEVSTTDPGTFIVVPAVMAVVVALASYLPAHAASRVSPLESIASE